MKRVRLHAWLLMGIPTFILLGEPMGEEIYVRKTSPQFKVVHMIRGSHRKNKLWM